MKIDLMQKYNMGNAQTFSYYYQQKPVMQKQQTQEVSNTPNITKDTFIKKNKKTLIGFGAALVAISGFLVSKNINKMGATTKTITTNVQETVKEIIKDFDYKKSILNALGLKETDINKLDSIVGKEEFLDLLSKLQKSPEAFSVGENFANVKNKIFNANLHIHTTNSDGQMSVEKLLNLASKYADKFAEKNNKPFIIGITDHDTVNGCIEALKIITKEPEKFKNLKLVLGTETKAYFNSQHLAKPKEIHLLAYCLDPFEKKITQLNKGQMSQLQNDTKNALSKANTIYSKIQKKYNFTYSFEDLAKIRSSVLTSPCDVKFSMKDYMEFRLIYADIVENNPKLIEYLSKNNIKLSDLDFATPKFNITNPKENVPYWTNYVDETKKYILEKLKEKSTNFDEQDLNNCFKNVSNQTKSTLDSLEKTVLDFNSGLLVKIPEPLDFDTVMRTYANLDNSVCGIAHPCILHAQEQANSNINDIMEELFANFKKATKEKPTIFEGYYQGYWPSTKKEWIDFSNKLGEKYGFIKTGGLDSHYNNIFTDQSNLKSEVIDSIIG